MQAFTTLSQAAATTIDPTYYPYTFFSTLHAARVALVYNARSRAARVGKHPEKRVTLRTEIAGFLIAAWGGNFLVYPTLGLLPPPILSYGPLANYISIFTLVRLLPQPPPWALDTLLPIFDSLTRSTSIVSTLSLCQAHADPLIRESVFLQMILGALSASGGGLLANTLDVWAGEWRLVTPPCLTGDIWANWDVLAGLAGTALYSVVTSRNTIWTALRKELSSPVLGLLGITTTSPSNKSGQTIVGTLTQREGANLVMLLLALSYAFKAYAMHWHGRASSKASQRIVAAGRNTANGVAEKKKQ